MPDSNIFFPHFLHVYDENEMVGTIQDMGSSLAKFTFSPPGLMINVLQRVPTVEGIYRGWWDAQTSDGYPTHIANPDKFRDFRNYIASRRYARNLKDWEEKADTLDSAFDPVEAVDEWYKGTKGNLDHLLKAPSDVKSRILVSAYTPNEVFTDYLRFEKARCEWLASNGLRAVALDVKPGVDIKGEVAKSIGLLEVMQKGFHYLGSAAYGHVLMNVLHDDMQPVDTRGTLPNTWQHYRQYRRVAPATMVNSWAAFRCIRYDDELRRLGFNIFQVLTEFGLGNTAPHVVKRDSVVNWKTTVGMWQELGFLAGGKTGEQVYAEELHYASQQFAVYRHFLKGAALFTCGAPDDNKLAVGADIRGTSVLSHLKTLQGQNPPPPPPPPPPVEIGCIIQVKEFAPDGTRMAKLNVRQKPYVPQGTVLFQMTPGQKMTAKAKAVVSGVTWINIETPEKQSGWVSGAYVDVSCTSGTLPTIDPPPLNPTSGCASVEQELAQTKAELLQVKQQRDTYKTERDSFEARLTVARIEVQDVLAALEDFAAG